jgi:hypothetical protein
MVLPFLALINLVWSFVILIYDRPGLITNTAIVIIVFTFSPKVSARNYLTQRIFRTIT